MDFLLFLASEKNISMLHQVIFIIVTIIAFSFLAYSFVRVFKVIRLLKSPYPISPIGPRIKRFFINGIFQERILRFPVAGILHVLVFWGFLIILFGSLEMLIDGLLGTERIFSGLGSIYNFFMGFGDVFALIIAFVVIIFFIRRFFHLVKRFNGVEMTHKSHIDATFALFLIFILMISLLLMNASFAALDNTKGLFPVGEILAKNLFTETPTVVLSQIYQINWWIHILTIFVFMNYLPYSKHFHVFMSLPNVFLSKNDPLTRIYNMERVTQEVKLILSGNAFEQSDGNTQAEIERFGMKDVTDGTWKNYIDSLTCTQCGRCTSVCPANLTGKLLSPRKIIMDYRSRMTQIMGDFIKKGNQFQDKQALLGNYISKEELWACTTCNACAQECPLNIDHPSIILEMRRYLVMEESSAPSPINTMFSNTENNGAPWQYPPHERIKWAEEL
ncbi:MAG TPA: 4Fe-4S dicluster domain-containing protein [Bacteroidales bacterium]|nr:4Fe-4S dicluster domain-containing protein [Bacteroidales bacterium]